MDINFPNLERKILEFWRKNGTFKKSILNRKNAPDFVFYEGPPTANGKPGIHHVLSRVFKDIICRYKTMQGFKVLRKAGWDTHGLPVELEIEKKLGLKSKKDIEKFGIAKFNKLCKTSVWNYKKDWEELTERIAFWLDMKRPYITYETNYIETVWWIIKKIWKSGLIYRGHKVVPYCPRCGTTLSSHEVALGYEKVKEKSVYLKFKIISSNPEFKNTSILSWTTTPWTLPGNVALAINPKFTYLKVKTSKGIVILAKERLSVLGKDYEIVEEIKSKDLIDVEYKPLFSIPQLKTETSYKIYPADFITTEEGTGVVHTAVMYGEEDYDLGKKVGLPTFHTVTEEGKFIKELGGGLGGLYVKSEKTETLIIEHLKKNDFLFAEELYEHDYPFCWRCDSPLLYYAKDSWFINMQKIKKDLVEGNKKINWIPTHLKNGRFGEWLKEVKDWAFSRERYWGTPLPIWQCRKCGNLEVIGSKKDLISKKFSNNKYFILRHGESQTQIKKITVCWPEKTPFVLTKKGEKEALLAAKALKRKRIDLIFSSDITRTKQTAEIVARETGVKLIFDNKIREFNVGFLNGKKPKEVWEFLNGKDNLLEAKIPKGESLVEVKKRMINFLDDINRKYQNKNILIVSHELPLTILENSLAGKSLEEILKQRQWEKEKRIKTGEFRKIIYRKVPIDEKGEIDFHRPYIDEVKFYCQKCPAGCQGLMERTPEVIDCWFDSGAMPFAQHHYPFEKKEFQFPADYISEAIDQTRGWFYTLHAISILLGKGPSYKNVISLGHVLDEKGEKMSKSKGNIVDPWYIVDKYGADAARWYFYTVNQSGDPKLFAEKDVDQAFKKFILTFWNSHQFYKTYVTQFRRSLKSHYILDRWIISRLNELIGQITQKLDNYDVTGAARAIESFVIEDLSQWYIRRSRKRFQKPETKKELKEASEALGFALLTLTKLTAPFIPFLSETIFKQLTYDVDYSVHLEDWPKANKKLIDKKLEDKMIKVREVVALALAERAKAGIKVRQPLNELRITNYELRREKELLELIKEEVNVKEITFGKTLKLDTKITSELKEEGIIREIVRNIQEMRKKSGLKPKDEILVQCSGTPELNKILEKNKKIILTETKAKDFLLKEKVEQTFLREEELKIDQQKLWLAIKKL
ncbi:MAG: class I tRNA ligase family protein [bacterium]|nr:class I tRNA ligase family protein [bacterium]